MTMDRLTDEILMAYADGELDRETAEQIAEAAVRDSEVEARIAAFRRSREVARDAFREAADEPVPAALEASIKALVRDSERSDDDTPATVVPFSAQRPRRPSPALRWGLALAATVAAVAIGLGGYVAGLADRNINPGTIEMAAAIDADLAEALDQVPTGGERVIPTGTFHAIASFQSGKRGLCREFDLYRPAMSTTVLAVACDRDGSWETVFAVAMPSAPDVYKPASSVTALEAYLETIEAGSALTTEAEGAALKTLRGDGG